MTSIEGPVTIGNVIDHLLKRPGRLIRAFIDGTAGVNLILILSGMASLVVFGLLLGTFSGSVQLWAAPLKVTGGTLAAVLICLPSLYIFSALGGVHGKLSNVMSMLFAAIALTGLLLLGFAPVLWVFSQSTESVPFVGFLALAFWLISLIFGLRLLIAATHLQGMLSPGYIKVWMSIFVVVTLQMSTALRPIIGTADSFLPKEKRFFLQHWLAEIDTADSKTTIRKPAQ
ncbi:MAG: ABC-type transport system, permease component [Verrucomicrobiaceae bacterium]|nr:ABC-type transport system, permease component [Verrucomicrobiaceae bacterium]